MTKTWTSNEIRALFLSFFEKHDHLRIDGAPLVPRNDPTLLYINSGMAPLKPYFTGAQKPPHPDLVNVQPCIRTRDIDDVGDRHHLTFFEMLGQWSIGNYFKDRAIELAYELLVDGFGFDPAKLFVTCYDGDKQLGVPRDEDSARAWQSVGIPSERIVFLGVDNFWGPAGETGPCGPCTEVFFDTGEEFGPTYKPGTEFDTSRYIEIWNAGVFMQYDKRADGSFDRLPFNSVDTGSGVERMTMILNGHPTVYETDVMAPLMDAVRDRFGGKGTVREYRMITDHLRASAFILCEGVVPGNEGRAYIPRRLLRKCIAVSTRAGLSDFDYDGLFSLIVDGLGSVYPQLVNGRGKIRELFNAEKAEFERTLSRGLDKLEALCGQPPFQVSGEAAFSLFSTYGLPVDIIRDVVREKGGTVDEAAVDAEFARHQEVSRAGKKSDVDAGEWSADEAPYRNLPDEIASCEFVGYETMSARGKVRALLVRGEVVDSATAGQHVEVLVDRTPFYAESGGQVGDRGTATGKGSSLEIVDTVKIAGRFWVHRARITDGAISVGDELELIVGDSTRRDTMRNHSATHLMHSALRQVLGEHVKQAGSLVDADKLRFDFDHPKKVTAEELAQIERIVNRHVRDNWARETVVTGYDDAVARGALAFFGDTYGEQVRMVQFGPVSTELCGGTHVDRTGDIGLFRIVSEQSVASGVRRIVALTGTAAVEHTLEESELLHGIAGRLKASVSEIPARIETLLSKKKERRQAPAQRVDDQAATLSNNTRYLVARLDGSAEEIREEALRIADRLGGVAALVGEDDGKARMVVAVAKSLTKQYNARELLNRAAPLVDGRGGGQPHLAQGGGQNIGGIDAFIAEFPKILESTN